MALAEEFESSTRRLGNDCSIQLSYASNRWVDYPHQITLSMSHDQLFITKIQFSYFFDFSLFLLILRTRSLLKKLTLSSF